MRHPEKKKFVKRNWLHCHLPLHLQEKGVFLHIVKKLTDNGRKD